jgi:dethiobiotin synthetase
MSLFITATGTGIGKTLVTTALCHQLRQQGKKITALKPVISGMDASDNDCTHILKSNGIIPSEAALKTISLYRYRAPISPDMAAAREGNPIDLQSLIDFSLAASRQPLTTTIVEGIGGIMTPLNTQHTVLDWMTALNWPTILVTGSYLGSLSHTLMAIETLRHQPIALRAIIVSESLEQPVPLDDTIATLKKFTPAYIPIVKIPRITKSEITTTEPLWTHVPPLSWLTDL